MLVTFRRQLTVIIAGTGLACATPPAASTPTPANRSMRVTNHTAGRVELYLIARPGAEARSLGQLGAGRVTEFSVPSTATVSAYLGSGITRTHVVCSYPKEEAGRLIVDCGKP